MMNLFVNNNKTDFNSTKKEPPLMFYVNKTFYLFIPYTTLLSHQFCAKH